MSSVVGMGTHFAATTVGRGPAREHDRSGHGVRQRADALFAAGPPGGSGLSGVSGVPGVPGAPGRGGGFAGRAAWREAVFERLPVWLQLRCGLELRTVAAVAGVLVLAVVLAVHHFWAGRPQTVRVPPLARGVAMAPAGHALPPPTDSVPPPDPVPPTAGAPAGPAPGGVVVDVAGKVRAPGVLRLPAGSRVTDALKAAGGALPGTSTAALNLARLLADGEQVVVGGPAVASGSGTGGPAGAAGSGASGVGVGTAGAFGSGTGPPEPVSLSSATPEQLDTLPGVGPVLARHIVEYRVRHGGFSSVGQLRQVTGVGDRRFQDLRALVRP